MYFYLLIFVVLGISLTYLIDSFVVLTKGFGGVYGKNALAANLGSNILLINRIVVALTLPALGYLIDGGLTIEVMLIIIICSTILLGFLKLLMYKNIIPLINFIYWVAVKIYGKEKVGIRKNNIPSDEKGKDFRLKQRVNAIPIKLSLVDYTCRMRLRHL